MMKPVLLLCMSVICWNQLYAQYIPLDIPVSVQGRTLRNPWAGGLNLPQFSPVDLNNDNIDDIVVYDRKGRVASTFINNGTAGQVDYDYAPDYMRYLPQTEGRNFMLFRDYNCDGIADIFGMYEVFGRGLSVAVWKGSYHQDTIRYERVIDELGYNFPGSTALNRIFVYNTDLPAIDDVDNDGDLDILGFTLDVSFSTNVFYYRNMSVEDGNPCDSIRFKLQSTCWGLFSETGDSSKVVISPRYDSCANNPYYSHVPNSPPPPGGPRHVGANTTTVDFNGDGSTDIVLGGVTFPNVNMVHGSIVNQTILMSNQDYHYPSYDKSVDIFTFPSTYFMDVNNDGKTDFLAAPSEMGFAEAVMDSVGWYYENIGSNSNMVFDYRQKDFLVGDMIDVGNRAYPTPFDYDADGDLDLIVGGMGRPRDIGVYDYGMSLWRNIGTTANPSYELVTMDYANTNNLQAVGLYPAMGDLDGDGDVDMICGEKDGTFWYFENTAGVNNTAVWAAPVRNYNSMDVGNNSTPQLVDLDRDGDLDLVSGNFSGDVFFYENLGNITSPNFSATPSSTNLSGYSVSQAFYSRNTMPLFVDTGNDWELYLGHRAGNIIHFGNIANNLYGTYDTLSEHYQDIYYGSHLKPAGWTDIDGDGKTELLVGTGQGGIMFLHNPDRSINTTRIAAVQKVAHVYPNPANNQLTIQLEKAPRDPVHLTFYNALGQPLLQQTIQGTAVQQLDITALPAGVLFIELVAENYRETISFIKE